MRATTFYHRNLPHYQPSGGCFHVCFRLAGSVPRQVLLSLQEERESNARMLAAIKSSKVKHEKANEFLRLHFDAFERHLDSGSAGPLWLLRPDVADIVAKALRFHDGREYDLFAHTIMPNHVHMAIQLIERNNIPLYKVLQSIKRYSARHANLILHRSGTFWQPESYDHVIRDEEELEKMIAYILANPVKAGLAPSVESWPWNYCRFLWE